MPRLYLDSSVLISAFMGENSSGKRAFEIIDDPENCLVLSEATKLELLPKPFYHRKVEEVEFYEHIFSIAQIVRWDIEILNKAYEFAIKYGLSAMDAIHVANAIFAGVDEFVTAEKESKPLFRVQEIRVRTIR